MQNDLNGELKVKVNKNQMAILATSVVAIAAITWMLVAFTTAPTLEAETTKMVGKVDLVLRAPDGSIKDERHFDNLVLNDGFTGVASRTFGGNASSVSAVFDYIAIGSSSTAAAATQHVLSGELARGQDSAVIYNNSTKLITIDKTFAAGTGTGTIQESGLFNSATANTGPMLARQTFSSISKGSADSLTVSWTITLS